MPQHIDGYRTMINRLAEGKVNARIPNGMPQHASILMESMFKNATAELRIFSKDLNDKVFDGVEIQKNAILFLSKPYSSLKILLQNKKDCTWIDQHPLLKKLNKFIESSKSHGSIEIRNAVGSYAKDDVNHFAVMDNDGFRYETDHVECKAVANFYEPKISKKLVDTFDLAFSFAKTPLLLIKAS